MTFTGTKTVFVIDDDAGVRAAIQGLLKSVGLRSAAFGTTREFLRCDRTPGPSCLLLDVRLPEINGLDFQRELPAPVSIFRSSSSLGTEIFP
jgi:FixJ family two-component response regulator